MKKHTFLFYFLHASVFLLVFSIHTTDTMGQKQMTDFVYKTLSTKSLNGETYGGLNGVFWAKTINQITNSDELSVFDPRRKELIFVEKDKLPNRFIILQFYLFDNIGYFLAYDNQNQSNFFFVCNDSGQILFREIFPSNLNVPKGFTGLGSRAFFSNNNLLIGYTNGRFEPINLPKHNGSSIVLTDEAKIYNVNENFLIVDNGFFISADSVFKIDSKLQSSIYIQNDQKLLNYSKNGLFEVSITGKNIKVSQISDIGNLTYIGKETSILFFKENSLNASKYYKFQDNTFSQINDGFSTYQGAFFENDSLKIQIGISGGFAGPTWSYTVSVFAKRDSIHYELLENLSKEVKYEKFNRTSRTSFFGKTKEKSAWIINYLDNSTTKVVLVSNSNKNLNPVIFEKVANVSPNLWVVKDFENRYYYFNTSALNFESIKDPYLDRVVLKVNPEPYITYANVSFREDWVDLYFNGGLASKAKNQNLIQKDTIVIGNPILYTSLIEPKFDIYSKSRIYIGQLGKKGKLQYMGREGELLNFSDKNKTYQINIGTKANLIYIAIYFFKDYGVLINQQGKNTFYDLATGGVQFLANGFIQSSENANLVNDALCVSIENNTENKRVINNYIWKDNQFVKLDFLSQASLSYISDLPKNVYFFKFQQSEGEKLQKIILFDALAGKAFDFIIPTNYEIKHLSFPYLLCHKPYENKALLINVETQKSEEFQLISSSSIYRLRYVNDEIYYDISLSNNKTVQFAKYNTKTRKTYYLNASIEYSDYLLRYFVYSKKGQRELVNLEFTNQLYSLGNISKDNLQLYIDENSVQKTPYYFGSLASWSSSNLYQLQKSMIKFEELDWVELNNEDVQIPKVPFERETNVFPNPNAGYLNITTEDFVAKITIMDNGGRVLLAMENPYKNQNDYEEEKFLNDFKNLASVIIKYSNAPSLNFIFKYSNGNSVLKKVVLEK